MTMDQRNSQPDWRAVVSAPLDAPVFQPLSTAIAVEIAARSVCGKQQQHNTDHYLAIRLARLQETLLSSLAAADLPPRFEESAYAMLVADGLDEQGPGARASRVALSTLAHLAIRYGKWNVRVEPGTTIDVVEQGEFLFRQVNEALIQASRVDARLADMETSLTAVYIAGADLFFAHVGHSRAFLFRNGVLIQLTMDHSLERLISASAAVRRARLEARRPRHADQSKAEVPPSASDVNARNSPGITIEHVQLWSGDRILLCTNGLTDAVREDQIADVLASQRRPEDDCQRLVDLGVAAGAPDSVTVVVADYRIRPTTGQEPLNGG